MKSWKPVGGPRVQGTGWSVPDFEEIEVNDVLNLQ